MHNYHVYILSSINNNVLYVGVTNDIVRRVFEHKKKLVSGFTSKYNVTKLVYFEQFDFIELAIKREKQIKGFSREKKDALIMINNPDRADLYNDGKITLHPNKE